MNKAERILLVVMVLEVAIVSTAAAYDSFIDLFYFIWR